MRENHRLLSTSEVSFTYDIEHLSRASNLSCRASLSSSLVRSLSLSFPNTWQRKGVLSAFTQQVRLVRGHFGNSEPIDFLALLIGYAISGERTLADYFERLTPFGTAFMALFGRSTLPHRATLSRFLADVDRPCLEAFRTLFEQSSFLEGWTKDSIGGVFDRQGSRSIVFDVDATRQAARQRSLPCDPMLPPAKRRLDAVCAIGDIGPKARGCGAHPYCCSSNAYSPMDRHGIKAEVMATIRGNWQEP